MDVGIVDNFKSFRPFETIVVHTIGTLAYALAQSAKFIGVKFIPIFYIWDVSTVACIQGTVSFLNQSWA